MSTPVKLREDVRIGILNDFRDSNDKQHVAGGDEAIKGFDC